VIVEIAAGGTRLLEADDFHSFKVVTDDPASLAAGGVLARVEGGHAWVLTEAVRELAGAARTPEWEERFDGMLEFARSHGWVDDEAGAVRAHVEQSPD
jgi:hypothetical protein